ncbi:MAG: cytochrome P450 [Microcystis viridis Mv_BB_P_19951000_S69]|uniref:Cytochrome P450 n=1 Tax=Microcystis viridis Mv_BB_P_19951000_S68D TaxID=2486270 RepID=A0A552I639_MICVR|nr:MAG: cytochrome P450 [Microcystis viridis Mv_BB_P_19951000_S68]TRU77266.1 MAG: cytochrome P450 [Microcystis viridis Mv_BB_P_19951000_S69]TRU78897.1 MAG: cytochrome P450 [Microcystis viridis Mv_BB_P_19951000_S68D]TRU86571.1 MAG: cytochrome P450 [Microcystis viridis Mv_BB_P_19951000_S69D]
MTISKDIPLPPGSFGLPLLGETIAFLTDGDFASKRHNKYGQLFRTHIFGSPTIILSGAEANRFLLSNENKYFAATWPKSTRTLLGSASLAVHTGDVHASRRRLIYQAFQPRAIASYIPTVETITAHYLERWQTAKTLSWYPELRDYTLDIACKLFVGLDQGSATKLGEAFDTWCAGLFTLPLPLPWTAFGKALRCREELLQAIETIILERQKNDDPGQDALAILLQAKDENGESLSLAELKDQVLLLLFAGHETLTSAIATFCLQMALHPDIFQLVLEEITNFDLSTPLSVDTLKQMTYLDRVLKEVLRFTPPVGGGFRRVIEDCQFNGYHLPKGWVVQYQISNTHKDNNIYSHPETFDPDRFLAEEKPYGYIPFGAGLRECIGKEFARLEMKILAVRLVEKYDWQLLPNQDLTLTTIPTPHPRDGLQVTFKPR